MLRGLLVPGKTIGNGRYRLLTQTGNDEREHAQLWRARDGQLGQDVALTVLIGQSADRARRTLERCVHLSGVAHPGVAQVINVLSVGDGIGEDEGIVGVIAAEWTPGTDVADLAARRRMPLATVCHLLEPIAAAVEHAHHRAVVLGIGHPRRLRLTPEGGLRLAFPAPSPDASPDDDVHGLGAVLYLLLTGRWPDAGAGAVPAPQALRPEVPGELSDVTMRSLDDTTPVRIRTSATIRQALRHAAEDAERTETLPPVPEEPPEPDDGQIWVTKRPLNDPTRKRKLAIAASVLVLTSMAVVAWLGTTVADFFSADSNTAQSVPSVSVTPSPSAPTSNPATPPPNLAPQPANPVPPAHIEVYNTGGDTDSADKAGRAIDGDPATAWKTDAYFQQFPAFKPGIGLIVSLPQAVNLTKVSITSPSAGTQVEIRAASSNHPNLADTTVLRSATLVDGVTTVDLPQAKPTQYVLVWITHLAGGNQHFQSALAELTFSVG